MKASVSVRTGLKLASTFMCVLLLAGAANAEVRPKVLSYPGDPPKRMIFIGNSFFYYNNSMHGHVRQLLRATPKATALAPDLGHHQRLGHQLA